MDELDLLKLDKDIARAAKAERKWLRALRADAERVDADAWFEPFRYVTTRMTFQQLAELPDSDPFRLPMLAWVRRLALTRIAQAGIVQAARARQHRDSTLDEPERGTFSVRSLVARTLVARDASGARAWLRGAEGAAPAVLLAERTLRQAQVEITSRLGAADLALESPYDPAALATEAQRLLSRTDSLARATFERDEDIAGVVIRVVARDVPGVWPARAHARWLLDQFDSTDLLDGLSLDLGPTPPTLGASTFARALARFGAAYARAAASTRATFVHAQDPTDAHALRRGALFASLLGDEVYLRQKLGLSRETAQKAARALGATFLAEARLAAVRTLHDFALLTASQIHEVTEHALGVRVSPDLSGVLPRPCRAAPLRLAAVLLAGLDRDELRDRFDDDWFRNPHALFALRERDEAFRWSRLPKEMLDGAGERLARGLEDAVG
jgi:hypothetical protein